MSVCAAVCVLGVVPGESEVQGEGELVLGARLDRPRCLPGPRGGVAGASPVRINALTTRDRSSRLHGTSIAALTSAAQARDCVAGMSWRELAHSASTADACSADAAGRSPSGNARNIFAAA